MIIMPSIMLMTGESDRQFMESVYLCNVRLMYAVARKYAPTNEAADEIVQESLIALIGKVTVLRKLEEKALRVYVAKTVRSKAISHGLHEGRTVPFPTAQAADTSDSTDVEQRVMHEESLREALAAIRRLPDKEQLVLRLKLTTDMTNDEIASRVGISPESVRQYLSRARAKVARDVFGKEETT